MADLFNQKYYFLSRPRRFGKSLLLNTIKEIFLGNKELFKGLWIYDKIDWEPHPVIKISFSNIDYKSLGLEEAIDVALTGIAEDYHFQFSKKSFALKFDELIKFLAREKRVVILIDEYDKPIIDYLDDLSKAEENRDILKNFYSVIKDADKYIRFLDGENFVYNPVSLLNLFRKRVFNNYWFTTGTPTFLTKKIKNERYTAFDIEDRVINVSLLDKYDLNERYTAFDIEDRVINVSLLDKYDLKNMSLLPLLFQTGYLTIKK
ncbi:MAG: AAA family ATPase, partial [Bacteroidetes bacterium 4572_114]